MGFEEVFVFVVVGCVASYRQRMTQLSNERQQTIFLWGLAIALPSFAIVYTKLAQASLPLIFVSISLLLWVWIYRNWTPSLELNVEANLKLTPNEEKQLKSCFPAASYQLKALEYRPQEIFCRGNLRSPNPKIAYDIIVQNIENIFADRFHCYLQESQIENSGLNLNSSQSDRPNKTNYYFYLIPSNNTPQLISQSTSKKRNQFIWIASIVSLLCTAFTLLATAANINRLEDLSIKNLQTGIPYLIGIASIFLSRAIAQFLVAKRNRVSIEPPILLPCLGGFGCLGLLTMDQTQTIKRHSLFDLAAIPAIAGLMTSTILLVLGNWVFVPESPTISMSELSPSVLMPSIYSFNSRSSIFTYVLQSILQSVFSINRLQINATIASDTIQAFSPLTLAGWTGLVLSALQIMPFDLLDGGNLVISMFGYRQTIQIARITRLVFLAIALLAQPWIKIYSLLLFLLPNPRPMILNECIEIDEKRDLIGMILIAIAIVIILPVPKSLLNS